MAENTQKRSREEQAEMEAGRTDFARGVPLFLTVLFLLTVLSVPALQLLVDKSRPERGSATLLSRCQVDRLVPTGSEVGYVLRGGPPPTAVRTLMSRGEQDRGGSLVDRSILVNARVLESIKGFESCMDENAFVTKELVPTIRGILTGWLGAGGKNELLGRDGWLFYKPDVDHLTGPPFLDEKVLEGRRRSGSEWRSLPEPDPLPAIQALDKALKERGIALVVMPTPLKPSIYPDKLSRRFEGNTAPLHNPSYHRFVNALTARGVRVFDPAKALMAARRERELLYLKGDTHWSPKGVRRVARLLAAYLTEAGLKPTGSAPLEMLRRPFTIRNTGDIAANLNLAAGFAELEESVVVDQVVTRSNAPWQPDSSAGVLLLGDSFTNIYSLAGMGWGTGGGLAEQLSAELGVPIDVIAQNDAGAHATRGALAKALRQGDDRLAGKSVVIYQFAARELSQGDWKNGFDYTAGAKRPTAAHAGNVTLKGTVREIIQSPEPGQAPYRNCAIPIHLGEVTSDTPSVTAEEAVVFVWGMLDGRLTEQNRLTPGQRITIEAVPYNRVASKVSAYRHEEFTDPHRMGLDLFWGDPRMPGGGGGPVPEVRGAPQTVRAAPETTTGAPVRQGDTESPEETRFLDEMSTLWRQSEKGESLVIEGKDGWLFLPGELRHLAMGAFWGEAAQSVSRAAKPENRDPLPAIIDFQRQLEAAGIDLLLVPVPAKAEVYPDKISKGVTGRKAALGERRDPYHRQFLEKLAGADIPFLDLTALFLDARKTGGPDLFCRQDSHWSDAGCGIAAKSIAERISRLQWYKDIPKTHFRTAPTTITITGDLWKRLTAPTAEKETIRLVQVQGGDGGNETVWRESPVLLLGDSHTLVFHAGGDMLAVDAGLADLLALELGFGVDLVGVRGSGATPSRVALRRRGDNLKGKRMVVWVFTCRELTESTTGWASVPVIEQKQM